MIRRFARWSVCCLMCGALLAALSTSVAWSQPTSATSPTTTADSTVVVDKSLDSPRSVMFTFLTAMGEVQSDPANADAAYKTAGSTLAGGDDLDHRTLRQRCDMLLALIDRIGTVTPEQLPDKVETLSSKLLAFQYFPQHPRDDWVWDKVESGPRGSIVLTQQSDGRWQFSRATLNELNALYASMIKLPARHQSTSQLGDLITPTWERTDWQGWLNLFIAIFIGVALGKFASIIVMRLADRMEKNGGKARATALRDAAGPLSLGIVTFGLAVGLQLIYLEQGLFDFSLRIIKFLYLLAFGWLLYNLVDVLELWLVEITSKTDSKLDDMLVPLVRKTLRIFLIVVFSLVMAQNVFGLNITGWLAGLGIAGLAVSLAAQDSIKNLFGSVVVFFDRPFAIGDVINFDNQDAMVEEIGFRSTRMRTFDGHLVTVPNMRFNDGTVRNISARPSIRRVLDVTITYDTPPEKIERGLQIIKNILAEPEMSEPFDLEKLAPRVVFNDYNAASLNIRVVYWYLLRDGRTFWDAMNYAEKFNLKLFRAFANEGIEFAFPTQTLYLAGDVNRPLNVGHKQSG